MAKDSRSKVVGIPDAEPLEAPDIPDLRSSRILRPFKSSIGVMGSPHGVGRRLRRRVAGVAPAKVACLVAVMVAGALVFAAGASAEPLCTDAWTGPSAGSWKTAEDWSTGAAPSSTTVACIAAGKTVDVSNGSNETGVLEDKGALVISGGSLELTNAMETEPSSTGALTLSGGTLTGPGNLDVTESFSWNEGGTMSGSGKTVLQPAVSGTMEGGSCSQLQLVSRHLVNEGTLTFGAATLELSEGARLENKGTFKANSNASCLGSPIVSGSGAAPLIVNTGTFEKTSEATTTAVKIPVENRGTVAAQAGTLVFRGGGSSTSTGEWSTTPGASLQFGEGSYSVTGGHWSGPLEITGANVTAEGVNAVAAQVGISSGVLTVSTGSMTVEGLSLTGGILTGAGTLEVSKSFSSNPSPGDSTMSGSGKTIVGPAASGTIQGPVCSALELHERTLVNEGTLTFTEAMLRFWEGARLENRGTFKANSESTCLTYPIREESSPATSIVNTGTFEKTAGTGTTRVDVTFENLGVIKETSGKFEFLKLISPEPSTLWGGENPSAPGEVQATCGKPVSCATGNESTTQTDLSVGGRGVGLDLTRTYNSQAAAEGVHGPFGYGWSSSFSDHLVVNKTSHIATLYQANGSTVPFTEEAGETFKPPVWTQDALSGSEGAGYTLTRADQTTFHFNGTNGRLETVTDRNGNATTLSYGASGLEAITDPAGRKITLKYSGGLVESATDPMGHVVKYAYEGGNLATVTQPGESSLRWQFAYNSEHELETLTDGRGQNTTNKYNGSHQVVLQTDPLGRELSFSYEPLHTVITNSATGAVIDEHFASTGEPISITHGSGTPDASTESLSYNAERLPLSVTDGDGHTTKYTYEAGNRTSMVNPDGNEAKWTYNATHDVVSTTTPKGETTTIKRDSHGNAEEVSRPAPGGETQATKYKYNGYGLPTAMTDALAHEWKYEYDSYGDTTAEIEPTANKRTWAYNEDSQETSTTSPRGNGSGAEPARYTTTIERDAQGRPLTVSEPDAKGSEATWLKPANTSLPTISGTDQQGYTLGAAVGEWEGTQPITYSYQWQGCNSSGASCSNIIGDTSQTHPVGSAQVGATIRVVVTATNTAGSTSATSAATSVVTSGSFTAPAHSSQFGAEGTTNGYLEHPWDMAVDSSGDIWVVDTGNNRIEEFNAAGEYVRQAGSAGTGTGQFKSPDGIAIDPAGHVWVADTGNDRLEEFSSTGSYIATVGSEGSGTGHLSCPSGLTVDAKGDLLVADTCNNRVEEFSNEGTYIRVIGSVGSGNGQLSGPKDVALDAAGNVWVADTGNQRVEEFTSTGTYLSKFGSVGPGSGQFEDPSRVTVGPEGNIWVTDSTNDRIQIFDASGEYLYQFGNSSYTEGELSYPGFITPDGAGDLYVADIGHNRISEFSPAGTYLDSFGSTGSGSGEFSEPEGLAVGSSGELDVSDSANSRLSVWSTHPTYASTFGSSLSHPSGMAVDSSGNVWVTLAYGDDVKEYSASGTLLGTYGSEGSGNDEFNEPEGIAINKSSGNIYIADEHNNRVEELSSSGIYVRTFGSSGSGSGDFDEPEGVASDPSGDVWVTDQANNRIEKFSPTGTFIAAYGSAGSGNGEFHEPSGIAVSEGYVYVSDLDNDRVEKFNEAGEYVSQFGSSGSGEGHLSYPGGITPNGAGDLYVADIANNRIEEFSTAGAYVGSFGTVGSGSGELSEPEDVAMSSSGALFVADSGNGRVSVWSVNPAYSSTFGSGLSHPSGTAVDSSGDLWVTVAHGDDVKKYSTARKLLATYGSEGSGNDKFNEPEGIAINKSTGNVYIADEHNNRVEELSSSGTYVRTFGSSGSGSGEFDEPDGVAIDPSGDVWVTDQGNGRIEKFSETGTFIAAYGSAGSGDYQFHEPSGIAISRGYVYISDLDNDRIEKLNEAGEYASQFNGTAKGPLALDTPADVKIYGSSIYVLDRENGRVESWTFTSRPTNTSRPTISGESLVGDTLTASVGSWGAAPSATYSYQWQRCNEAGGECSSISGATTSTHAVVSADKAHTVRVVVEASNSAGTTSATSLPAEPTPVTHVTTYGYDADGNIKSVTDPNSHKTTYTYNAEDQPIKVEEPSGATTETEYNADGEVIAQTNGDKDTTKYVRNVLDEVTEVTDPLSRTTKKEYDHNGSLTGLTNPDSQTTTYTYDEDGQLTKATYSTEVSQDVEYKYDEDGDRTSMKDATGTTSYAYDQLDRLTKVTDGDGNKTSFAYNLDNEQSEITYPNTKSVTQAYDTDDRLSSVKDWLGNTTSFAYNPDSDLKTTVFPSGTGEEDHYGYDDTDAMTSVAFTEGSETLASLNYSRDEDAHLTKALSAGMPGPESTGYAYNENSRLTEGGSTAYEYDAAGNPTKIGSTTYSYDKASELDKSSSVTYAYSKQGERTKATPSSGPATTYGYNQAEDLTSVNRPEEGSTPKIEDSYAYSGDGLRASETIKGTARQLTWDESEGLPLLLNDETNSYIYGPADLPIEQISSGGTALYLHHDQQGSTRMLTNTSGTVEGTMTYDAYGNETGHTGSATTPLGYDRQYTSTDTGLIYLRARTYDPSTAQFATQDPLEALTGEPYGYAGDDPVNYGDPTGLCNANPLSSSFWTHGNCISEASNAAGITPIVTSPAVIDAGAVAICALPFTDVACPAAIAVAFGSSTLGVAGQGICTNWSNPAKLAAEEAVNGVLGAAGAGGVKMAKLAEGAPAYAKAIIQGGPAALLGGLDAARAGGSECGCS